MVAPVLFHIGYHKTATTWMQRQLFVAENGYRQIADHDDVFRHIVGVHGLLFDPAPMRTLLSERLKSLMPLEVPVVSSELLCGHPFEGGRENDVYAERLARIAPHSRILISIRSQFKILPSLYMQYLSRGGTMTWEQFFSGPRDLGYFGFSLHHFEYDRLVEKYQQLFGKENVLVLTQESLTKDLSEAASVVAGFAGNEIFRSLKSSAYRIESASFPEYAAPLLRRINHIQRSTLNPSPIIRLGTTPGNIYRAVGFVLKSRAVAQFLGGCKPVSSYVRAKYSGRFTESNARLSNLLKYRLDLSGYD